MTIQYKTRGVCAKQMNVTVKDGIVEAVEIIGGCSGNTQGVSRLVEGMEAQKAIATLSGIRCGHKQTSCPDQLSIALKIAVEEEARRDQGQKAANS